MKMSVKILVLYLFLLLAIVASAQTLSVNHFDVDTKFDLSAKMNMIKDLNGIPCALIKIQTLDEVTKIEGNIVERADKGVEVCVYLSSGTKVLKIYTLHHPSIDINFSDYIPDGLQSNTVYQLELKSDLPPEVLFGSSDATRPVKMESKDSPLLPDWWNKSGHGNYVGISYPSYDGEIAKRAAILNAIDIFAQEGGMNVEYVAKSYVTNESESYNQYYLTSKESFSVRILQEYYNSKGEYFVLSTINNDSNSANKYLKEWFYQDIDKVGSLRSQSVCDITIGRQPIKNISYYTCEWNDETVRYSDIINDIKLWNTESSMLNYKDNIYDNKLQSLGFEQKRFLTSLPLIPDSLQIMSSHILSKMDDIETFQSYVNILGKGKSQPRKFVFIGNNENDIFPIIKEVFLPIEVTEMQEANKQESEYTGLDVKYLQYSDNVVRGEAQYSSPLWEISKNNAFVEAVLECNGIVSKSRINTQTNYDDENSDPMEELLKSTQSSGIRVYPLWFMDATLRSIPNKKKNKNWESTLKSIDNRVEILVPVK
ncbi:MAG: hypothetical protein NC453_21240 [Muribaculum sp.]|nr:hypothetical protein [Muribaculum sp.]